MHILKLDTHLNITQENLIDIAGQVGKGFSEGLSPMPWKIIEGRYCGGVLRGITGPYPQGKRVPLGLEQGARQYIGYY